MPPLADYHDLTECIVHRHSNILDPNCLSCSFDAVFCSIFQGEFPSYLFAGSIIGASLVLSGVLWAVGRRKVLKTD